MKALTHYCHKHKRTYLNQLELNSPPINFGWVSWSEQKIKIQADAGTEFALRHWVIGWPCGQSLDLVSLSNPTAPLGERRDLTARQMPCPAFQAELRNSKISMLTQNHFLSDSTDPFDCFLKGWEWPGIQGEQGWFYLFLLGGLHSPFSGRTSMWDCQKCP